uniref:SFRICE_040154 n=1 Tax=Spodoptera frugiperda TaxID=7108 RepID=A0A2H1WDL6_SPOFR
MTFVYVGVQRKCGRAMLRHEWADSTGVIPRPSRKLTLPEDQLAPAPFFPILDSPTTRIPNLQKAGNALLTPLVFRVSIGGGDCMLLGEPAYTTKKEQGQEKENIV